MSLEWNRFDASWLANFPPMPLDDCPPLLPPECVKPPRSWLASPPALCDCCPPWLFPLRLLMSVFPMKV